MSFSGSYKEILKKVEEIQPVRYGYTRNFIDGAVTQLSPYISRGVISTRMLMEKTLSKGHPFHTVEKFIQELAWRDYWQQVWIEKGSRIDEDMKQQQKAVQHYSIPTALVEARTGIEVIDKAIREFYERGYLHNHIRMYIAAITCNMGKSHWKAPAQWMYYHLLDGDWASNSLSWQWVAGSNSNKKYYANQDNINHYCHDQQKGSYLDIPYEQFEKMEVPFVLKETRSLALHTRLPATTKPSINPALPSYIYNYYNLDPCWHSHTKANRILLLEPSVFQKYPVSPKAINFVLDLAKNIEDIQVFTGEFEQLQEHCKGGTFFFKEHPLNRHYKGNEEARDWMFTVKGYYPSFFSFWKKCKKELRQ